MFTGLPSADFCPWGDWHSSGEVSSWKGWRQAVGPMKTLGAGTGPFLAYKLFLGWPLNSMGLNCTSPLIGEGNGTPLQCSCLENPGDGGAWWAAVYGVAQSWTWLKRLSSSSSPLIHGFFFPTVNTTVLHMIQDWMNLRMWKNPRFGGIGDTGGQIRIFNFTKGQCP